MSELDRWIKEQITKGYTKTHLTKYLQYHGFPEEVSERVEQVHEEHRHERFQEKLRRAKVFGGGMLAVIILIGLFTLIGGSSSPTGLLVFSANIEHYEGTVVKIGDNEWQVTSDGRTKTIKHDREFEKIDYYLRDGQGQYRTEAPDLVVGDRALFHTVYYSDTGERDVNSIFIIRE